MRVIARATLLGLLIVAAGAWCLLPAAVAAPPAGGGASSKAKPNERGQSRSAVGKHVEVVCDFDDWKVRDAALEAAEAAWVETTKLFGLTDKPQDPPAKLYLYATVKAYEKAEKKLTKGQFKKNLAFTTRKNPSAHLVVQPPMSKAVRRRVDLTEMTRRLIAHEAAHLCRNLSLPNHDDHPRWLADGVARLVEQAVVGVGKDGSARPSPFSDKLVLTAQQLVREDRWPSVGEVLHDEFGAVKGFDIYAVTELTFEFLASRREGAWRKKTLNAARSMGGGSAYAGKLGDKAVEALKASTAEVDAELKAYIQSLKPEWDQVLRSLDVDGEKWTQTAFPESNAVAWRMKKLKAPFAISGGVKFLPSKKRQMNLLLGRTDQGFYSIALVQGYGVTVFRFHSKAKEWEKLGDGEVKALKKKLAVGFEVRVKDSKLVVRIEGTDACAVELSEPIAAGPWGVGAQAGSAGIWRGVRVKRDGPQK